VNNLKDNFWGEMLFEKQVEEDSIAVGCYGGGKCRNYQDCVLEKT